MQKQPIIFPEQSHKEVIFDLIVPRFPDHVPEDKQSVPPVPAL
jgi:hypothetical protein